MKKIQTSLLWSLIITLLGISSYQTYTLASIGNQLNKNGLSFGKAKVSYNFSSTNNSAEELPDMVGGC